MNHLTIALTHLDSDNDDHWTADGQARVDVVSEILIERGGEPVQRQEIIDAAPMFTRDSSKTWIAEWTGKAKRAALVDPTSITALCKPEEPKEVHLPELAEGQKACDLPLETLMQSWELLEVAAAELDERSQALLKRKSDIDKELSLLYSRSEMCSKRLTVLKPRENPQEKIRAYQEAQRKANAERVRRRRSILDGIGAKGLNEEIRVGSKLDSAMSSRKAEPGSTRPAMGMPVKGLGV